MTIAVPADREIFVNRTINLRSIKAIGYDMDYTLVHYRAELWEERAYAHLRSRLSEDGWPVGDLGFVPTRVGFGHRIRPGFFPEHQVVRDGHAVHVDEGPRGPRALGVDGFGNQFLAGPGLTGQ